MESTNQKRTGGVRLPCESRGKLEEEAAVFVPACCAAPDVRVVQDRAPVALDLSPTGRIDAAWLSLNAHSLR